MQIFVDADACPVVAIIEKIAKDNSVPVMLLCDTNHVLSSTYSKVVVVGAGADAVDYKLISICHKGDIVVSQDYGVAAMALGKGAYAIHQSGKWYTDDNIDQMLMERHLSKKARRSSRKCHVKGPKKRTEEDDERFAQSFEKMLLIAKYLNETHVLTCREYMCRKGIKMHRENEKEKKLWSVTTISDMLKNEVYLGKIIWNKKRVARTGSNKLVSNDKEEWIVVENAHEPIISDELFRKANEKAFTNQKKVLAKRGVACPIFFCPTCGRRLGFTSRETGYRCMQAHISGLSGCAESKMDRKEAEETVLDAARNMAQFISENLEKKKREWHKTILKEENIATLKSEKKRLSSRKMKLYSDYRSEVLDKEGYMEELEKTTSRILEITLQIAELENEIAVAKKKCDEATEKEMEVNEIAALQDFDKIQLSKIIEKVFIYEPGRMEISWKMDDIFYKEEKA